MRLEFPDVTVGMAEDIIYAAEMSKQGLRVIPHGARQRQPRDDGIIVGLFIWDEKDGDYRNARLADVVAILDRECGAMVWRVSDQESDA
jgi:hypothetical protein